MERDSLSRIEIGTRFVTDYELKVLAKVLGVSPLWLLDDENVKAKLFCPEIAGLFCRIAGLFCHDSRANLSLKPVCFGIAIS